MYGYWSTSLHINHDPVLIMTYFMALVLGQYRWRGNFKMSFERKNLHVHKINDSEKHLTPGVHLPTRAIYNALTIIIQCTYHNNTMHLP